MGDFYDLVRRRRMVRSFSDEPVDPGAVDRILDAARRAPSAGYSQGVEFVVVTDARVRRAVAAPSEDMLASVGMENFAAQAPVHVVLTVSPEVYKARYREADKQQVVADVEEDDLWTVPFWYSDAGAAQMLILLAAVHEGLGAAFVGILPSEHPRVRELLGIPEEYLLIGIALLGHPSPRAADYGDVSARPRRRRPFDAVVHRERW